MSQVIRRGPWRLLGALGLVLAVTLPLLGVGVYLSGAGVAAPPPPFKALPASTTSTSLVISQVYGGGGNTSAPYQNDFIEIFNPQASPVNMTGWSVQYASAANNFSLVTGPMIATIPAGGYFLVKEAGGANGLPLPTADFTGTINLSATAGKVALVNSATLLTCGGTGNRCGANPAIIDLVGFGSTASDWEGTGPTPAPSN